MSDKPKALVPVKAAAKPVSLMTGNDAKVAAELVKGFSASQKAGRIIMAFGLFAWEVKHTQLKHGQWGEWMKQHAPALCRRDKKTGELLPKALSAVNTYMGMCKDVLDDMGYTIEKYFNHISHSHGVGICRGGKFLLAPVKGMSAEAAEIQKQICDRVDGKTVKQIRLGFSQVEEDEDTGELRVKRGQMKGSKGLTKEQREAAKLRAERERIEDLETAADDNGTWLEEFCDDKNGGMIDPAKFAKFAKKVQYAHDYCTRVIQARKG